MEEHGADISEPTVRRFVAEVRARQELPLAEVAVPQHHPLGEEAEVDFGTATVILTGAPAEVQLFIMRLSASGRAYPRAYLNEGQEVFLDGHVRAFQHFGGVPARIPWDSSLCWPKTLPRTEIGRAVTSGSYDHQTGKSSPFAPSGNGLSGWWKQVPVQRV